MAHIERFAPSPTGFLHLGHAYSALTAWDRSRSGEFLLRLEDIDIERSRPEYETAIFEDLNWLGIEWSEPVLKQSKRMPVYQAALDRLDEMGLTYRCSCTRRDISDALGAPQEGVTIGPDGVIYPGTCRGKAIKDTDTAIRLDMTKAMSIIGSYISFHEDGKGKVTTQADDMIEKVGDIVLARKDIGTSYHLSVVVDDAFQKVTHVTRGEDLFSATPIHRALQIILRLPEPVYYHHKLIRDEKGKRLAKRDDARAIRKYRQDGATPEDIRRMVGL